MQPADGVYRILFQLCKTQKDLHDWIEFYLGVDLPGGRVDPDSTSSPMELVWELYSKAAANDDPRFDRILNYASRDSFKTLSAAILEVLCVFHLERDVCHMAAIDEQAQKCQDYVKNFLEMPYLRDYKVGNNITKILIAMYRNSGGDVLGMRAWKALPEEERKTFIRQIRYIKIVTCTLQGANSEHVPWFTMDELDVVPKARVSAYNQSLAIPAVSPDRKFPITFLTSTRKFSFGLVQKEIDKAAETGLHIRHWGIIDVTEACPASRHRPDLPRLPIYVDDDGLAAIDQEAYEALDPEDRGKYEPHQGYEGCLKNCRIFAACKGRLATQQKSEAKTLKPIDHVINLFRKFPLDMAQSELLCRKASLQGLIYPRLERSKHMLTAAQIYEKLVGEHAPAAFDREDLAAFAKSRGMEFFAGMDFGFTHKFSVVTGFRDGNRFFVIDCQAKTELEPDQQVELCDRTIKRWDPVIFPDMSSPQMIRVFRKNRYRMRQWKKGADSVLNGINVVRLKLTPALSEPELYFLSGDIGVEYLVNQMTAYHWALEIDGTFSKEPDKVDDDSCDAARYCLMNVFPFRGKVSTDPTAMEAPLKPPPTSLESRYPQDNWMSQIIKEHVRSANPLVTDDPADQPNLDNAKGKAGGFIWEI